MQPITLGTEAERRTSKKALATAIVTSGVAMIMAMGLLEVGGSRWLTLPAAPCPCGSGKKYKKCCLDRG